MFVTLGPVVADGVGKQSARAVEVTGGDGLGEGLRGLWDGQTDRQTDHTGNTVCTAFVCHPVPLDLSPTVVCCLQS